MAFVNNVDTKMTFNLPILYSIDEMSYDAMDYEEEQSVSISMSAYYYVGEPKVIVEEHTAGDDDS